MKAKLIDDGRQKTYAIMFDRGDEAMQGLRSFAAERRLAAAQFKRLDPEVGVVLIDLQE